MGTIFKIPIIEPPELFQTLTQAKSAGIRLIAAHPHTEERALQEADLRGDSVIVLGSEGAGDNSAKTMADKVNLSPCFLNGLIDSSCEAITD